MSEYSGTGHHQWPWSQASLGCSIYGRS